MSEPWQNDWNAFVDLVSEGVGSDMQTSLLVDRIDGKPIQWQGVLEEIDLDPEVPTVWIELPARTIEFEDGRAALLDGFSLPVADKAVQDWTARRPGAQVRFSARMGSGNAPFPPIEVTNLRSGKTIVMVRLSEGAPVD